MSKIEKAKELLKPYNDINEKTGEEALKNLLSEIDGQTDEEHIKYILSVPALVVNKIILQLSEKTDEYNILAEELEYLKAELMNVNVKGEDIYSENHNFGKKCKDLRIRLTIFVNSVLSNFFLKAQMGAEEYYKAYEKKLENDALEGNEIGQF